MTRKDNGGETHARVASAGATRKQATLTVASGRREYALKIKRAHFVVVSVREIDIVHALVWGLGGLLSQSVLGQGVGEANGKKKTVYRQYGLAQPQT